MRHGCPDSRPFDIYHLNQLPLSTLREFLDRTVASQAQYLHHWYPQRRFTTQWRSDFQGILSFVATDANEPIGLIRLIPSDFVEGGGEMEYLVHPGYRRCGVATQLCTTTLLCTEGRLVKRICPTNTASQHLAKRLGFQAENRYVLGTRIWTLERP